MSILLLVLGLFLFIGLVVVHEWGHFIAARRNGVEVEEFGIFFPPRLWRKKMKSGFDFTINLLPLGGFVRLKGEHDADTKPGTFGAAPLKAKIKIMVAGVVMNLVVAFLLLTGLALVGMPRILPCDQFTIASDTHIVREVQNKGVLVVERVNANSPAAMAGLQEKDQLLNVAGVAIDSSCVAVPDITKQHAGQTIDITVKRGQETKLLTAKLNTAVEAQTKVDGEEKGYLGVTMSSLEEGLALQRSTWSAPIVAGGLIKQFSEMTYKGIGSALADLFRGNTAEAGQQVAGPVGIFVLLRDGSLFGYQFILMVIAIISLTLALINILPIPALDGGRLFVTLLFRVLRKPLPQRTEDLIHGAGFALLMLLFVVITVVDVKRFF